MRAVKFGDKAKLTGSVVILQHDLDGNLIKRVEDHNLVVKSGRNLMRDLLGGFTTAFPSHLAAGTNSTAPDDEDVSLAEEVTRILIISRPQGVSQLVIRAFMGSTVGNGFDYVEAGLFNGSALDANAVMFSRATHDPITKSTSNTITYIWTLQMTSI